MRRHVSTVLMQAASLFEPREMPDTFEGSEYARGVTDLATRLLGLGMDDMPLVWALIRREAGA